MPDPLSVPALPDEAELTWLETLDTLASRARLAAAGEELPDWTPPAGAGRIPEKLKPLARSIIAAQSEAIGSLREQMHDIHGRGRVVKYMSPVGDAVPVYHDELV